MPTFDVFKPFLTPKSMPTLTLYTKIFYNTLMTITDQEKKRIKQLLVNDLKDISAIQKIIIFGSFLHSNTPNDLDLAIIDNSNQDYLSLALSYRKKIRNITEIIPVDLIPIHSINQEPTTPMEIAILNGETIYEK